MPITENRQKTAIVVLSDPKNGGDEALGRLFNALAAAFDYQAAGADVKLQFQGAGTRWLGEIINPEHPAYALFQAVKETVTGASCGCAEVFGATEGVQRSGFDLISDNPVPGTSGLPSLARLTNDGFQVLTF